MTSDTKKEDIKNISEISYEIKKLFSCEIKEVLKQTDINTKKLINLGYITTIRNKNMPKAEKAEFYLNYSRDYLNN